VILGNILDLLTSWVPGYGQTPLNAIKKKKNSKTNKVRVRHVLKSKERHGKQ